MLADTQANYGISSAHAEQIIMTSFSDITMITHAIEEGSISFNSSLMLEFDDSHLISWKLFP